MGSNGTAIENITIDTLDSFDAEVDQAKLHNLIRKEIVELGRQFRKAQSRTENLEFRCKMRAMRLYQLGMTQLELEHMFGVTKERMNQWLTTIK